MSNPQQLRRRLDALARYLFDTDQPVTAQQAGVHLGMRPAGRAVHLLRRLERRGVAEQCGQAASGQPLWRWCDQATRETAGTDGLTHAAAWGRAGERAG